MFTTLEGVAINPVVFSEAFTRAVGAAGCKATKFHGLRHMHISHLLKSGAPVHVVSARAGHARPSITFDAYFHLLGGEDDLAANQVDEMLRRTLK